MSIDGSKCRIPKAAERDLLRRYPSNCTSDVMSWANVELGTPAPDYPSGVGEGEHLGRLTLDFVMQNIDIEAQRAMGLTKYDSDQEGLQKRERQMLQNANAILGFV